MKTMYLAYFDESGDSGLTNSPTTWFVLNALLVHETVWLTTLDSLIALRRSLRDRYGISPRSDLKGAHFRSGKGAFKDLNVSRRGRMGIYEEVLQFESQLDLKTFSIAIHKVSAAARGWDARYAAWTFALQRLHRFCVAQDDHAAMFPDEGHGFFIRQRVRHMRRYNTIPRHFGPGSIDFKVERILEDPSDRRSQDSYFVQMADWNAYAAHRSQHIDPRTDVRNTLWDAPSSPSGDVRLKEVNRLRGGPTGIVKYP
jgi:hypothetical protein